MGDDLEERLKSHARAFEGLMSLIPAKEYYGKDASITSEQWRKTKKQSKKEWQDAKRAKLDPSSHKTAKDVMDENAENARKRKRELDGEDSSDIELDLEKEKPLEGMKAAASKQKKQKAANEPTQDDANQDEDAIRSVKAEKRRLKREQKKEKKEKKLQKSAAKKARKEEALAAFQDPADETGDTESAAEDETHEDHLGGDEIEVMDISGLVQENPSTATPTSAESAASTGSVVSAASSSSSIVPPSKPDDTDKPKKAKSLKALSPQQHEAFKERLQTRLAELRAARKADGPDGRPAKNRQELIEARRKKQQEKKEAQKANRQLAKEDEARMKAEAELARLRGSGSPYSMSGMFPRRTTPEMESNLAFGRVAWADGQQMESNLSSFRDSQKKKGVSDPKTALEAAQKKKARINGLDEDKRKDIEEKDLWLAAKKRAQGERVHDDANLLKKTLKRKEKAKAKSKQEWKDRITNIEKGKELKQKKREENLKKRKDDKKLKGVKGSKVKKPTKKPRRPGFEGTMKGR